MWQQRKIAVIVPAFREAKLIGRVLAGLPAWVDSVWVVDDASDDSTEAAAKACADPRVRVLRHAENRGVGAAIVTGYRAALEADQDVLVVMAGDNQMDPGDLAAVVSPITSGEADYVKGNRFTHERVRDMPLLRRLGGRLLSFATRCSTGLRVSDCQCGYTALAAKMAARLPLAELWPRYGYPNDLLGLLSAHDARVREVSVRPVYADERSGVTALHVPSILLVIARRHVKEAERARRSGRRRLESQQPG
jgi:glycosyltransferase involved in cell wall biosynthesis